MWCGVACSTWPCQLQRWGMVLHVLSDHATSKDTWPHGPSFTPRSSESTHILSSLFYLISHSFFNFVWCPYPLQFWMLFQTCLVLLKPAAESSFMFDAQSGLQSPLAFYMEAGSIHVRGCKCAVSSGADTWFKVATVSHINLVRYKFRCVSGWWDGWTEQKLDTSFLQWSGTFYKLYLFGPWLSFHINVLGLHLKSTPWHSKAEIRKNLVPRDPLQKQCTNLASAFEPCLAHPGGLAKFKCIEMRSFSLFLCTFDLYAVEKKVEQHIQ